jgi:hypothetical protein
MSFYYAQIDENKSCFAVSELAAEMNQENLIRVGELDISLIGKIWNGSEWENPPEVEET